MSRNLYVIIFITSQATHRSGRLAGGADVEGGFD